jgi:hypothetical protein
MAAGVAHDLNNMLATVLGQAGFLRRRVPDPTCTSRGPGDRGLGRRSRRAPAQASLGQRRRPRVDHLAAVVHEAVEITAPMAGFAPAPGRVIGADRPREPPSSGTLPRCSGATNLIVNAVDAMLLAAG